MFEGLVKQLLVGYLGRYVKDIHQDQLKITLWHEEVLLENVELILEAFDYLQLPFALKQGCIGKLSIKIPWKKLGWDPIIIVLENVFVCASCRDDHEWSSDTVTRREIAAKKAKLAAAELAKFSKRVCDNQVGQSFISYITAKILDSIQVSIRNVHLAYHDKLEKEQVVFGLRFSSLIITKQNPDRSFSGKLRGAQGNKDVEISDIELLCRTMSGADNLTSIDDFRDPKFYTNAGVKGNKFGCVLASFDLSLSLSVDREKLDNKVAPPYSVNAELAGLAIALDEVQLLQILVLFDNLRASHLREKYWCYRPWSTISRKDKGWQVAWWHYAQESVLSDVRKKMKRTSWKYFGQRLSYRRRYVNLYKTKLRLIRQEQPINESVLCEMEQLERESDIDDILSYRSIAESELQEFLLNPPNLNRELNEANIIVDKFQTDESFSGRSRGWLNWLSLGMLGAGGTDDLVQFSGVVSDDIVKDIYKATKFNPVNLPDGAAASQTVYLSAVKITIPQLTANFRCMKLNQGIAALVLDGGVIECKYWAKSAAIVATVKYLKMVNPYKRNGILSIQKSMIEDTNLGNEQASLSVQIDISPEIQEGEISVKVMLEPVELTYDSEFVKNTIEFYNMLNSYKSQSARVLASLNGIKDVKARLISKAECILSNSRKVVWDAIFTNVKINIPYGSVSSDRCTLVVMLGSLLLTSKRALGSLPPLIEDHSSILNDILNSIFANNFPHGFRLEDLYNFIEIQLNDCEVKIVQPYASETVSIIEKFYAPIVLASCIIPDEAMLKQFEVHMILPSLRAHFSSFIYGSVLELMSQIDDMHSKFEHLARDPESRVHRSNCASNVSQNFMRMVGSACFLIHLDYDGQDSSIIAVTLQEVDIQYTHKEFDRCIVCIKALKAITYSTTDQRNNQILCLIGNLCPTSPAHQHGMPVGHENPCDTCFSGKTSTDISILLHYDAFNSMDVIHHHCTLWLNDIDVHCYPHIFKLIFGFYDRLCARGTSDLDLDSSSHVASAESPKPSMFFPFREFGFSNYSKTQPSEYLGISLDHFPFVTIQNSGFLGNLESSLVYSINEWKENLKLVDRKITLPKLPEEMGPEIFYVETLKSTSLKDLPPFPENSCNNSIFLANLIANELRVHFHDSSCIIGTTALTMCRSLLSVHSGSIDLLCSIEGLTLSSSWCPSVLLWGPHLPYLSSILNIRMKNAIDRSLSCQTELYFGIQNVCCILPPEYLTIVVGYFSLPEWSSNANKQTDGHTGSEHASCILYKFEILDSTLIVPVERSNNYYLKLKLPQLYCSFIPGSGSVSNNASDCVPSCFSGPDHKIAELNHALNFFGRDLSLFYLFPKDGKNGILMLDHHNRHTLFTLMLPLNADIWIEIPSNNDCSSASSQAARPTCIRLRLYNSQFFIRDDHVLDGYRALIDIINQFSLVGEESKFFKHDIPQFLQLKKSKKEHSNVILASSAVTLTELKCEVNSLSVKLCCSREDFDSLEPVATVDLQFECSASLRNEVPVSLGLYVSSIVLFANSTVLAQCISPCPTSSVIQIKLPMLDLVKNEISIYFPSFDIWLHLFEWNEIIELFKSYSRQLTEPSVTHVPVKQDAVFLTGKLKNVFLACHIPLWVSEEAFSEFEFPDIQEQNKPGHVSSNNIKGKAHRFVTVSLHGGASEISLQDREIKFQCTLGKISTAIDTCEGTSGWPFLQIHQINVVAEIFTNHTKLMKLPYVKAEVRFDRFEVWFSHHVLYFWHKIHFNIPEAGPSKFVLGGLDLGIEWRKASLLLIDGRWSCSAPFLEILLRNFILRSSITDINMEGFATSDLEVNYNNIQKVLWEPFVEPWKFQLKVTRIHGTSALLTSSTRTDIHLDSIMQLNLNITEPVIECFIRASEMLKDACGLMGPNDMFAHQKFLNRQITYDVCAGRYAPYIVQNLTSLPLVFHVSKGKIDFSGVGAPSLKDGKSLQPNSSVPVYISETLEEQLIDYGPSRSSDKLNEKQSSSVVHHFITIQFDGTPSPSAPISMDLVGRTCFEVDFSYIPNKVEDESSRKIEENGRRYPCSGCIVPVVIEVSVQRYSRLIQLYSAVILSNGTSTPLELRFDIPFGLSPKILGPVYPDADFPVPLHLSEAGRLSWRPVGNSYLWSETRSLLDILSREKRTGFVRPFVCYPRNPSSDPFRCCISVQDSSFLSSDRINKGPFCHIKDTEKSVAHDNPSSSNLDTSNKRSIHQINLMTPLVVKNYLPVRLSLTIESGGLVRTALLSEVETPFFHIDSSHDLNLVFDMHGYKPSRLNFQRTETFSTIAKFSGTKFSQSETLSFDPNSCSSPVYATVEKLMDASSGARELCVFVPLLLYNCTGFHLIISDSTDEDRGNFCIIPSCYASIEEEPLSCEKDGLLLFSSHEDLCAAPQHINSHDSSLNGNHIVSTRKIKNKQWRRLQSHKGSNIVDDGCSKVKACLYCPMPNMIASEFLVRVRKCLPEWVPNNVSTTSWSSPFSIVTPNGSTTVLVPDRSINAASIISVTSSAVGGSLAGRTRAVTFQPRYVISNACSKDLCYKQKATDVFFNLGVGQHTHLSWEDTTSELLVSIRFNEPGWQWSGSFSPDHLGDTQVKMRNYMSSALEMIRVEVQNGDVSGRDEKIIGNLHGNSGTNLILLSDDDTGFMPYRIDNFSKETLRVFQQKCVSFETTVHPYTSCPYAWDEPCAPHRLTIEVPGERTLGLYALDDVKNHVPVCLPSTVEKPERKLLVSVHAERARKVLSVMDATYHVLKDVKDPSASRVKENRKNDCKQETVVSYKERLSINIPYIGISLIDSLRQELLFVCAKNTMLDLFQSLDQQKLFFKIESLQVDNQLQNTRYPVILSFDHDCSRHSLASQTGTKGNGTNIAIQVASDSSCEPAFSIAAAKWRSNDPSLVSFEYIKIRVADFLLELEQEVILNVLEFSRSILLTLQGRILPYGDSKLHTAGVETRFFSPGVSFSTENRKSSSPLPSFIPIGAPWQQIHHRRQKKFYIELIDLASVKLTFSFSSTPWMLRNGILTSGESLIHRGLMALADIEGAQIHLKQLIIEHHMASWESIQEILVRHYTRQLLHETYKVFGSAGVIGNPMGFARTMGLGIKDFLSAPAKSVLQSPAGLITGVAQGTTSLLSNTVYAVSDAATQISRAAHKGIVAFTFDDLSTIEMEKQKRGLSSQSKGVINEFLEGLTGVLQLPIKGAEKHGLPGVLSGIALGVTGLVARPTASILEVTGKTAQSIRNRTKFHQMRSHRFRVRLPRALRVDLPLRPYSWEEAVGASVLATDERLKDEELVMCKALKQGGKFVILTGRLLLTVSCSGLAKLGTPEFEGVPADPEWVTEAEIGLESVIHADSEEAAVHIVGSSLEMFGRQFHYQQRRGKPGNNSPLSQTDLEFPSKEEAEEFLRVLVFAVERGKERGWGSGQILHQSNLK